MIAASVLQNEVLLALNNTLLPWLCQNASPQIISAEHPLVVPESVQVNFRRAPPLRKQGKAEGINQYRHWEQQALNSINTPLLLFVLEGEADFRIGMTTEMIARRPHLSSSCGIYTVALTGVTCLLVPPGVPISDNSRPHWERPCLEKARSHLLWFHILPEAAMCHTCKTQGEQHTSGSSLLITDNKLMNLTELLLDELRARPRHFALTAASLLLAFLLRVERNLASHPAILTKDELKKSDNIFKSQTLASPSALALERACRFIHGNLGHALSPALIASHAYVSLSQLKRIFRSEMDITVMRYVGQRRIDAAQSLLRNTNMSIKEIASHVGYSDLSHFSAGFARSVGQSPRTFRNGAPSGKANERSSEV